MNWKQKVMVLAVLAGCVAIAFFKPEKFEVAMSIIGSLAVAILVFEKKG